MIRIRGAVLGLSWLFLAASTPPPKQPAQWRSVTVPSVGQVSYHVVRPVGRGPFRTVIILHGSHGFAVEYLSLAHELARRRILAVAVCWFAGGAGEGRRFVTPLDCPAGTPAMPVADSDQSFETIDSVVTTVRAMPDSRDDQIALFGHSRGGGAVRNYILRGGPVQAAILNSAGYPAKPDLSHLRASVLILHGAADSPSDGGSAFTDVQRAQGFDRALRAAGKQVEAHYYLNGTHNSLFTDASQRSDEVRRVLRFIRRRFPNR